MTNLTKLLTFAQLKEALERSEMGRVQEKLADLRQRRTQILEEQVTLSVPLSLRASFDKSRAAALQRIKDEERHYLKEIRQRARSSGLAAACVRVLEELKTNEQKSLCKNAAARRLSDLLLDNVGNQNT